MNNIVTITLNPAFDVHCHLKSFTPESENYITGSVSYIGGKGINITRALLANNYDSTAIVVLGKESCVAFEEGLTLEKIKYRAVYTEGKIRENLTLHSPDKKETRLSFDSFTADSSILSKILHLIPNSTSAVAFAGRLPKGIEKQEIIAFLKLLKAKGVFLAVDCNSFTVEDLLEISPDFIKPNEVEIKELSNEPVKSVALTLHKKGIKHVLITQGGANSIYAGKAGVKEIIIPRVIPLSTVGAGDCTVAGFMSAIVNGKDIDTALKTAAAFGSASVLRPGTSAPYPKDIEKLIKEVKIVNT